MSVPREADTRPGKKRSVDENGVGYKHPPVRSRFPPGTCGNKKGRPRGRGNVADLLKACMNEPVPVRSGNKTRKMPAGEAMIRVLVNKAGQGDPAALRLVVELLEMTGQTSAVTEQAREKRGMRLPRPLSREEGDLFNAPARERDRQRYLAMDESGSARSGDDNSPPVIVPVAVRTGDVLATQGKLDLALAAYRDELERCKTVLTADDSDKPAQYDFRRAVARIGLMADQLLLTGEFRRACAFADLALAEAVAPFWIATPDPVGRLSVNTVWITAIRAHARMFLGDAADARTFYLGFQTNKRWVQTSWETAILQDFVRLHAAGHSHPLMNEIEERFAQEGWSSEHPGNKMFRKVAIRGEDAVFIQMHPDNIKSGDLLNQYGKSEEAAAVYIRNLKKHMEKLERNGATPAVEENLQIAVGRIERMAHSLLGAGKFGQALECADEGITALPDKLELHAVRAHALMFLDRDKEAQAIFLEHRGARVGNQPWEAAILQGFEEQRRTGRSRLLMTVIENEFAPGGESSRAKGSNNPTAVPVSALIQSSETQAGEMLKELGMLDEALDVYIRCLENYKARCANGQVNNRLIDDRNAAIERVIRFALEFIASSDFNKALDTVDRALAWVPNLPLLNFCRAHALMFLDREDEARTLYLQLRGQRVDAERRGEALILQDFARFRRAEQTRPLMDEIEKVFSVRQESDPALVGNEGAADDPHRSADGAEAGYRVQGPGMGLLSGSGRGPRTT